MNKSKVRKPPATAKKSGTTPPKSKQPLVAQQPQSEQQAAVQAGMFLYTNDVWSLAYFNQDDLHCMERELLG
jgi:hypothetical protein